MEFVYDLAVVTHLLGMAAVVGGYVAARPVVSELMVWGARAQLITGLILAGLASGLDSLGKEPDTTKLAVKLVIAIAVAGFAEVGRADAKRGKKVDWMTDAAGGLAIVNVLVAVLWN
ncbi:hypothetical protein [Nocardia caishijiensis]|uniref:Uncharacterized protein n=1 Tax=Nocardia caishijiensis TaxID=184756 RepID=A0ABQ6YGJ1_9NOCA|nr:hypothetical protein [Nocardia caishijiensis]KAF0844919.1 hypothetical protein FNL39_110151 [Nocardia caishijiensis]